MTDNPSTPDTISQEVFARQVADGPALPLAADDTLDRHTRVDLLKQERAIAAKYQGGPMWGYVVAALGGFAMWLALFPLTMFGVVHPLITLVVSTFLTVAGYVTCHEAMHDNIA
ncbi:MAG: beta-carotene hydroxylase, partial [Alteriqipengyuania sp.]